MQTVRDEIGLRPFAGGALVPTMGALHEGHLALIRRARSLAGSAPVVVSIYINPTQFNDAADFDRYPRDPDRDFALCAEAGADAVFAPPTDVVYPGWAPGRPFPVYDGPLPAVATEPGLEDRWRPGHFAGVCQVCRRLFELVSPALAVFGEKDWQQLQVIRALVSALALTIRIASLETVREPDGLAMSSRNVRLSPAARRHAAGIWKALREAGAHPEPQLAEAQARRVLLANRLRPDYVAVREAASLQAPPHAREPARALIAAWADGNRLIDNAPWPVHTDSERKMDFG